ncbi:MAG: bifunctional GNAT family N-acetyltransferase/(deoxy)nucleoside triphosphate pyrophosphohydrolase [Alphaproteobacteria bacterium]
MAATGADRLATARLILRPPAAADAPAIERLAGDAEVARYTARIPHPYPPGAAAAFVDAVARDRVEGAAEVFAITDRGDGTLYGMVGRERHDAPGVDEIGYWIGRPYWGRGFAAEALRALVRHAFADGRTTVLRAEAHPDNRASHRVLEKAGLQRVGQVRGGLRGVELDLVLFEAQRPAALPTVLVAAVALVDADGRVLIAERPAGKPMAGLWEFPGGKVQAGETPEQALIRELAEELGIDTVETCLAPLAFASHRYATFHLLMPLYLCRNWRGTPTPHEGQHLAWVRPQRLADYSMPPADKPLLAALRDLL